MSSKQDAEIRLNVALLTIALYAQEVASSALLTHSNSAGKHGYEDGYFVKSEDMEELRKYIKEWEEASNNFLASLKK